MGIDADNLWLIEGLYHQYLQDPQSVEQPWRTYFAAEQAGEDGAAHLPPRARSSGSSGSGGPAGSPKLAQSADSPASALLLRQEQVDQLIRSYRARGHLVADIDPLGKRSREHPELTLAYHGLAEAQLDQTFSARSMGGGMLSLRQIVAQLSDAYCRTIGVQFQHIESLPLKRWLQERLEQSVHRPALSRAEQVHILTKLTDAETWETFVHRKFLGARRFSLEGAESLIPLLDTAIEQAADHGVQEIVIGMAHRGRLNVMVNILNKSPQRIFEEFDDKAPGQRRGHGDVKYHLGYSSDHATRTGKPIHLSLCFNPSHLGFVGPVAAGRVRAKQDRGQDTARLKTVPIVVHGDAAFAGQGVTQEMLNMSKLPGYDCGGTIHIVVNNQVGFTTAPEMARSCLYATDVARLLEVPIFHVNGEDPEGVTHVIRLAVEFRASFGRDVIIDMYCYRRLGHNEGDEPTFTQPVMYQQIAKQPTVREVYTAALVKLGGIDAAEAQQIVERCRSRLEAELALAKSGQQRTPELPVTSAVRDAWQPFGGGSDASVPEASTALPEATLTGLSQSLTTLPKGFTPHPKIVRLLDQRRDMGEGKRPFDWGAAETLAYASLLNEGYRVRLSGQDSGRGTFSHRHAQLCDFDSGAAYVPLQHISPSQGSFGVWDSPLSEAGVVGFDYGYSIDTPDSLVIWEAQYGDFANGAQVIIDQFIAASEQKWNRLSGLTMLLPHGFEGAGPEHSSARLERFLSLSADDNMQVAQPTTPAQIFHLLRRQVHRKLRKPLIIMAPKSLLRAPAAVSSLQELAQGHFARVLADPEVALPSAARVVLCTGKIYYDLLAARRERGMQHVGIVRLEQLYPNPEKELAAALEGLSSSTPVVWAQEEPRNMGAWPHLRLHYGDRLLGRWDLSCVSREGSASPATGSAAQHQREQAEILQHALGEDK